MQIFCGIRYGVNRKFQACAYFAKFIQNLFEMNSTVAFIANE